MFWILVLLLNLASQGKDVNFEAARLLMALKDFEAALVLFRRSDR